MIPTWRYMLATGIWEVVKVLTISKRWLADQAFKIDHSRRTI